MQWDLTCADDVIAYKVYFVQNGSSLEAHFLDICTNSMKFDHVANKQPYIPLSVHVFDSNHHATVAQVPRQISKQAGIKRYGGKAREWMVVYIDGYNMVKSFFELNRDVTDSALAHVMGFKCETEVGSKGTEKRQEITLKKRHPDTA